MDINALRQSINEADDKLLQAFTDRMRVVRAIGEYKAVNGLPVRDAARERDVLERQSAKVEPDMREYVERLYITLFELSRSMQERTAGAEKR